MSNPLVSVLLMPALLLLVVLGFITLNRYIAYKERVALARLGYSLEDMDRHTQARPHGNKGVLWGGVITAMSGLALLLGLATLGMGAWLLGGLIPLFVGLGMVFIYFYTASAPESPTQGAAAEATGEAEGDGDAEEDPFAALLRASASDEREPSQTR